MPHNFIVGPRIDGHLNEHGQFVEGPDPRGPQPTVSIRVVEVNQRDKSVHLVVEPKLPKSGPE